MGHELVDGVVLSAVEADVDAGTHDSYLAMQATHKDLITAMC